MTWTSVFRREFFRCTITNVYVFSIPSLFIFYFVLINFQITFAGDSHMRYWCYYTLKYLNILPKNLPEVYHGNFHSGTVDFHWVPMGDDLRRWLLKKLEDLKFIDHKNQNKGRKRHKRTRPSLLIMDALAHNVARKTIVEYLKAFQRLIKHLKQMLDDNDKVLKNVRIIYVSTVPNPAAGQRGPIYFTKALSKMTLVTMHSLGVETLDLTSMLHSVNDKSVDGLHFMKVAPSTGIVRGEFGSAVADAIINYICS